MHNQSICQNMNPVLTFTFFPIWLAVQYGLHLLNYSYKEININHNEKLEKSYPIQFDYESNQIDPHCMKSRILEINKALFHKLSFISLISTQTGKYCIILSLQINTQREFKKKKKQLVSYGNLTDLKLSKIIKIQVTHEQNLMHLYYLA